MASRSSDFRASLSSISSLEHLSQHSNEQNLSTNFSDNFLIMCKIRDKLKVAQIEEFDSIRTDVNVWLQAFEAKMIELEILDRSLSIVTRYLDFFATDFFKQIIGKNPTIDWPSFKSEFKKYFTNFQSRRINEAFAYKFTGGSIQDYMITKMNLMRTSFASLTDIDLRRIAISSLNDEELISEASNLDVRLDQSSESMEIKSNEESSSKMHHDLDDKKEDSNLLFSVKTERIVPDLCTSSNCADSLQSLPLKSPTEVKNIEPLDHTDQMPMQNKDKKRTHSSFPSTMKTLKSRQSDFNIVESWLSRNYKRSSSAVNSIPVERIETRMRAFVRNSGLGELTKSMFDRSISNVFGDLPLKLQTKNQMVHFQNLKERIVKPIHSKNMINKEIKSKSECEKKPLDSSNQKPSDLFCDAMNCNKKFSSRMSLKRHQLIHDGVKNFECSKCAERFHRSDYLKRHLINHDKELNSK